MTLDEATMAQLNISHPHWTFVVMRRDNLESIGLVLLHPGHGGNEFSYQFLPSSWFQGFTAEAVRCVMDYASDSEGVGELLAVTQLRMRARVASWSVSRPPDCADGNQGGVAPPSARTPSWATIPPVRELLSHVRLGARCHPAADHDALAMIASAARFSAWFAFAAEAHSAVVWRCARRCLAPKRNGHSRARSS
jgi:Acetyltransferase (GNAT) domain